MRAVSALAIVLALVPLGTPLAAKKPEVLKPSSAWNMSYDKQGCRLIRSFGTGDQAVTLQLSKYAPGPGFEVLVSGQQLKPSGYAFKTLFSPGDEPQEYRGAIFGSSEGVTHWQFNTGLVPGAEYRALMKNGTDDHWAQQIAREKVRAAEVTSFSITSGVATPVTLELGKLTAPMQAMDTCLDDLVKSWGFDPKVQASLTKPATPTNDPTDWFRSGDYPFKALRDQLSGRVRFRLGIGADGAVTNCMVQAAVSDPAFASQTCDLVTKRARFTPALDAQGKPTASYWASSVSYLTPG